MLEKPQPQREGGWILAVLRRRWSTVVVVAAVAAAGAYVVAGRQTKEYSATAAILFRDPGSEQQILGLQPSTATDPTRDAATNQALVELPTVARLAAAQLRITTVEVADAVAFGSDSQSDVLPVTATTDNPRLSARIANAYVQEYITLRRAADRSQLAQAQQVVQARLAAIQASQPNSAIVQSLLESSDQLQLLASVQTGNAEVVETATPPTSSSSPRPTRDGFIGLVLGALAAIALVVALERRDRSIKSREEAEELYKLPVIGSIPESYALRRQRVLGTRRDRDAFRMLRSQLPYFDVHRDDIKRVLISSAAVGEGKSVVALNLARAIGQSEDKRVLLLEADLRVPSLGAKIGLEPTAGLGELLTHPQGLEAGLRELVVPVEESVEPSGLVTRYDVLLGGAPPPNPGEMVDGYRMTVLMEIVEGMYDLVIIDTPAIGIFGDAISLVDRVDGVIIVVRLNHSGHDDAVALRKQLEGIQACVLGIVINGEGPRRAANHRYWEEDRRDENVVRLVSERLRDVGLRSR